MEDAVRAFDAGAYLSAISLALTIPDVCGGRISPGKGSRERYESWFDEYVSPSYVEPAEYNSTVLTLTVPANSDAISPAQTVISCVAFIFMRGQMRHTSTREKPFSTSYNSDSST